jgi:hypothetical protein
MSFPRLSVSSSIMPILPAGRERLERILWGEREGSGESASCFEHAIVGGMQCPLMGSCASERFDSNASHSIQALQAHLTVRISGMSRSALISCALLRWHSISMPSVANLIIP